MSPTDSTADFEPLPDWMRAALGKAVRMAAPPKLDPAVVSSRPSWPLLVDAAVVSAFLPRDLAPEALEGAARGEAEKQVLGLAELTHSPGGAQWSLTQDARRTVLTRALEADPGQISTALARTATRFTDPVSTQLRRWVSKSEPKPEQDEDLPTFEARRAALALLSGVESLHLPDLARLDRDLQMRRLLYQFERMTGDVPSDDGATQYNHFFGREKELERLRAYVSVIAADSLLQSAQRLAGDVKRLFQARKPLAVWGVGGVGKTTLLAKFMLEHARAAHSRFPFAYLDFDRSTVSACNHPTLFAEICRQVGAQFENLTPVLTELRRQADELAKTVEPGSMPGDTLDRLQIFMLAFRRAVDSFLDSRESVLERTRPFLLVFDTFEIVQYNPDNVVALKSFVRCFSEPTESGLWPRLRLILSGRQRPAEFLGEVEAVSLDTLDRRGSAQMLVQLAADAGKPISTNQANTLINAIVAASGAKSGEGVRPLRLRLIGGLFEKSSQADGPTIARQLGEELRAPLSAATVGGKLLIDGILVRRVLDHISDKRVRALADPGLVVRYITAEVIRAVMAKGTPDPARYPADIGDSESFQPWSLTEAEASDIFAAFRNELALVEVDGACLRHRQDVRKEMLPLVHAHRPLRFNMLHRLAFEFFRGQAMLSPPDPTVAAEAIYHGLWLEVPYKELDQLWIEGPLFDPRIDVDEFPADSAASLYVRARTGAQLTPPELRKLPRERALAWLSKRQNGLVDDATAYRSLELVRAAAGDDFAEAQRRPELAAVAARLLYRAGLWRDSCWLSTGVLARDTTHQDRGSADAPRRPDSTSEALFSLMRMHMTLAAKCGTKQTIFPEWLPFALSMGDGVTTVEVSVHYLLQESPLDDRFRTTLTESVHNIAVHVDATRWRRDLRTLRLAALVCGHLGREALATYLQYWERIPRERPAQEALLQVFTLVLGQERRSELERLRGYINPARASVESANHVDDLWRREREAIIKAMQADDTIAGLLRFMIVFDHYDWRYVLANSLGQALGVRRDYSRFAPLHKAGFLVESGRLQDVGLIVRNALTQGRVLELAGALAQVEEESDETLGTPALREQAGYGELGSYPSSAAGVARALLSWHEKLLSIANGKQYFGGEE